MNLAQRVAVLLSLGVVLHVSSQVLLFEDPSAFIGRNPRFGGVGQLAIVVAHVGAWMGIALWLLRDRPSE